MSEDSELVVHGANLDLLPNECVLSYNRSNAENGNIGYMVLQLVSKTFDTAVFRNTSGVSHTIGTAHTWSQIYAPLDPPRTKVAYTIV